jgi:alpha-L-fucosidase
MNETPMNRFLIACVLAAGLPSVAVAAEAPAGAPLPVAAGPFQPTLESLGAYRCPEWFRDAKFGIWAHWGPQAVPMAGDWYARQMYEQGHRQYRHHLENYGHPSEHGYKDIIPLWKAEKWDPARLMALYKKAGARYFVSMGVHHDNFDLWDSKHQRWNAVNFGPKRDVVGEWQKAAKAEGLRFGVSEHLGASFNWFQDSHGADKTGPKAGVPYDGADPKYQDLYHPPGDPADKGWYSNNPQWQREWFARIQDLVDHYRPDLLYTDGGVPFGNEVGRGLIAHYYNSDAARRSGAPQVVYTCKQRSEGRWIEDLERGVMGKGNPDPWQTDTSIGDWFYNKDWKFRPVSWVIHMLVDIVAKNGNLLLNVVQRPDGSLDPEVEAMLEQMATWMAANGEAIYGTRPWLTWGEGPVRGRGGHFKEDFDFTHRDIRFTRKGGTLYAIALGWPDDGRLVIRSLARSAGGPEGAVSAVSLLGREGKLEFAQGPEGLVVTLPREKLSDIACSLKISGQDLKPAPGSEEVGKVVLPDTQGDLTLLPGDAELSEGMNLEAQGGEPNIGFWDRGDDSASWKVALAGPGAYRVSASCATVHDGAEVAVEIEGRKLTGKVPRTGSWAEFKVLDLGRIEVAAAGERPVKAGAPDPKTWKAINLRWVKLTREK